jgi:hypothetical protein
MAYADDNTGKLLVVKDLQKLAVELNMALAFPRPLDEITYYELNQMKEVFQEQKTINDWHNQ